MMAISFQLLAMMMSGMDVVPITMLWPVILPVIILPGSFKPVLPIVVLGFTRDQRDC